MKSRFVPPYYQRDLRLKLQRLNQGSKIVEEYYQELLIGLARSNIQEDDMDKCSRFFGGLRREIQDVLDYKEWTRFSQLYHEGMDGVADGVVDRLGCRPCTSLLALIA